MRIWLGTLTVILLALMPSVVPLGGSVAPASATGCSPDEDTFTGDGANGGSNGVTYRVLTFDSAGSCDWTAPLGVASFDYLVVGGGGGGAGDGGDGGGGGETRYSSSPVTGLSSGTAVAIVVGGGGAGGIHVSGAVGGDGDDSSVDFGANGVDVRADGGTGGDGWQNTTVAYGGRDGTGGSSVNGGAGGNGPANLGFVVGSAGEEGTSELSIRGVGEFFGGGGGGGSSGTTSSSGGDGVGKDGASGGRGGGGGGSYLKPGGTVVSYPYNVLAAGVNPTATATAQCKGSPGNMGSTLGIPGRDGYGGGGGGGSANGDNPSCSSAGDGDDGERTSGGKGGSGVVVLRYSLNPDPPTSTSVASGDGQMTLAYTLPTHTGGGTLSLEYQILLASDSSTVKDWTDLGETGGTTTVSPAEISNGTPYTVKLRAKNDVGSGYTSTEVTVGSVIPSPVGEILRLDGTNPTSYGGSGSTWTDISGESNSGTISGATWDSRSKSFAFDGSNDFVDLPDIAKDFSSGLAIHAVVDFGAAQNYERVLDFSGSGTTGGIAFGRFGTDNELYLELYNTSGGYRQCYSNSSGTAIQPGVHSYAAVLLSDGTCQLSVDGSSLSVTNSSGSGGSTSMLPSVAVRTDVYVGQSRDAAQQLEGSIQSLTVYNTAQTTPVCKPVESTFTGDGSIGEDGVSYKKLSFTTAGKCQWTVPTGVTETNLTVVGGGGGGGGGSDQDSEQKYRGGGGGGAGGSVYSNPSLTVTSSETLTVAVGTGGAGGAPNNSGSYGSDGAGGGESSVTGSSLSIQALGGGAGSAATGKTQSTAGGDGGNTPAATLGSSGYSGGVNDYEGAGGGAGGGGVGSNGSDFSGLGALGGDGGPGYEVAGERFGGGGGGGTQPRFGETDEAGDGGAGGGGFGGEYTVPPQVGQANLGGGGGGGGARWSRGSSINATAGGDGGSGIVVVRYSLSPAAPSISSVSSGDGSMDVAFTAPSHTAGEAITDYEYSFDGSTWTSFGTDSAGTETISGLTNGTAYTPRIRAVNANGNGVPVTAGSATTPRGSQALSWAPTNTTVEVTDGSVTLAPAASALGGVSIQYSVPSGTDPSCDIANNSTPTVTFSAIGDCVVTATALQGGAYLSATTDVTLSVVKAAQTVTFASVSDKTYGDASFSVSPSASSALTVTLTSSTTSVCTVSTFTVTLVAAGTCTLVASQAGNSTTYEAASSVSRTFTVAPKAITVSVSIADKNYDGLSSATVSGTPTLIGLVSGDANFVAVDTAEITAAFADPDAGAGKSVSVTLGDDVLTAGSSGDKSASYAVTLAATPTATISKISQATLSLTSASSMVFGRSIPLVATGGSSSGELSYAKVSGPCTVSGSTVTSTGAGSCVVTATRATDTNYNAVTSSNFTITVAKANQSINFTSTVPVSAVSGTTYAPAATATSGLTPSFSITTGDGTVCSLSSGVVTFLSSGTCVITAAQSGDSDYNAASSVTQTIVAGKINQTITFPAITGKDFDDPAFSAGASVSSGRTVTYATSTSSVCAVNASSGVVSIKTVGECTVTASSAGDGSYAAASDVSRTFTISPVVAGKPSITSVSFGDSSVTVAFGAPGFVGGDSIDGYQVVATSSGGSVTKPDCSTTSPCTITGLTNGESYTLTVAAINAAGVGSASDASPSITPARIADAVSGLATTPGDEQLVVTWTALTTSQLGGGSFTRYDVYLRVNGGSWGSAVTPDGTNNLATRTTTSYTFTGLTNGTAYDVKIVAITSVNSTALSSNTSTALGVPATVPAAVSGLTATALSNTTALASWSAPLDDGGSAVTAYSVNLSCTFVNATDTFCELSGLTAGSTVTVSVGGTNLMGTGSTVSVSVTMPGGSSGSSGGGSSGGGETVTAAPPPATNPPVVSPRRVIVPLQPTPRPRPFAAPVRIVPERGFDPDAGAKARIGGQPATVTKKPLDEGGLSLEAGAFQLGITLATPATGGVSGERENTDISVPTGQSTKVSGGGLLPGSSLQVWLPGMTGESPKELARIPVRTDGTFDSELSFTARQSETPIPIGRQVMQVTGFDEDGNQTVVDMVVNIGQGAPAPEPNRTVNELPDLSPGQSLATSAGTPETVTVEATPQTGQVAVLSDDWAFTVAVAEDSGVVEQADAGATITMVQTKTATVSGEGFQPDTRVDIWLFSDPTLLGSVIVSADGSFTGEVYMDVRYATVGEHTLQLQGVANDGFIKAANLGVVVQEPVEFTTENASGLLWWVIGAFLLAVVLIVVLLARSRRNA